MGNTVDHASSTKPVDEFAVEMLGNMAGSSDEAFRGVGCGEEACELDLDSLPIWWDFEEREGFDVTAEVLGWGALFVTLLGRGDRERLDFPFNRKPTSHCALAEAKKGGGRLGFSLAYLAAIKPKSFLR